MAYLDLSTYAGPLIDGGSAVPLPHAEAWQLNQLEREVVLIAQMDGLATLKPRRSRLWAFLFGAPRNYTLADPRLETLRRFVVTFRAGLKPDERSAVEAGFTLPQLDQAKRLAATA